MNGQLVAIVDEGPHVHGGWLVLILNDDMIADVLSTSHPYVLLVNTRHASRDRQSGDTEKGLRKINRGLK